VEFVIIKLQGLLSAEVQYLSGGLIGTSGLVFWDRLEKSVIGFSANSSGLILQRTNILQVFGERVSISSQLLVRGSAKVSECF